MLDCTGKTFTEYDFRGEYLYEAKFDFATLSGCNFNLKNIEGASFKKAKVSNCTFVNTQMYDVDFTGAVMSQCVFDGAYICKCHLSDICGTSLTFRKGTITESAMPDACLAGCDFTFACLEGSNFTRALLDGAILVGAYLGETGLMHTTFQGAQLEGTCLDPRAKPNGEVVGFEREGVYVLGYRTVHQSIMNGKPYRVGCEYTAPIFSVADTRCHPGLYLAPSVKDIQYEGPYIQVRARADEVHYAVDKWRCKRFLVIKEVE